MPPTLVQTGLIDVTAWDVDSIFAIFPQGARAKEAVFSPNSPDQACIVPNKRYLFKRSKRSYPDQYWGEIIAYRVGCAFGVEVPPAFAAYNSHSEICGALIEWFYVDGEEVSMLAGDFLTKIQPGFDRDRGTMHNLRDNTKLMRALSAQKFLTENAWKQWWVNALAFDALIGNTDRHQDNWGILFRSSGDQQAVGRLSPLFDNGTSLGHERFTHIVRNWQESDFDRYITRGTHHVSWSLEEPRTKKHFDVLQLALTEWPETKSVLSAMVAGLSEDTLREALHDLPHLPLPVALSTERHQFVSKLLNKRLLLLQQITQ